VKRAGGGDEGDGEVLRGFMGLMRRVLWMMIVDIDIDVDVDVDVDVGDDWT